MNEFIKTEKKAISTLDLKYDADKLSSKSHAQGKKHVSHQLASSSSDVQKGEYSNDDISQVIAIKSALTKNEENEEQNTKVAIKSPHDLDKMEDQYSMKANKSSEKKSMKRLLDETQVDESMDRSEKNEVDCV